VRDSEGNLYGTTSTGGDPTCHCGTVFKLTLCGYDGHADEVRRPSFSGVRTFSADL
jgi:uncharacterized repeat protein (TIGR03803 family)